MIGYRGSKWVLALCIVGGAVIGYVWGIGIELVRPKYPSITFPIIASIVFSVLCWYGARNHFAALGKVGLGSALQKLIWIAFNMALWPPGMVGIQFLSGDEHIRWAFPIFFTAMLQVQYSIVLPELNKRALRSR